MKSALYEEVVLKVPPGWARLNTLEEIVGTPSNGLQYTRSIRVVTQQDPLSKAQRNDDPEVMIDTAD